MLFKKNLDIGCLNILNKLPTRQHLFLKWLQCNIYPRMYAVLSTLGLLILTDYVMTDSILV